MGGLPFPGTGCPVPDVGNNSLAFRYLCFNTVCRWTYVVGLFPMNISVSMKLRCTLFFLMNIWSVPHLNELKHQHFVLLVLSLWIVLRSLEYHVHFYSLALFIYVVLSIRYSWMLNAVSFIYWSILTVHDVFNLFVFNSHLQPRWSFLTKRTVDPWNSFVSNSQLQFWSSTVVFRLCNRSIHSPWFYTE